MPTGEIDGEWYNVALVLYSNGWGLAGVLNCLSIPYSGYFENGSASQGGSDMFWSSRVSLSFGASYSGFSDTMMDFSGGDPRDDWGFPMRCIKNSS